MTNPGRRVYGFRSFSLDPHERVLFRDGQPVPLRPKDFEMLLVLVENNGRVVEKDELMKRVWPETFVEEANLSHHVFTLRKALGDDKEDLKYIETIPRRGYRFVAPVTELVDPGEGSVVQNPSLAGAEPSVDLPADSFAADPRGAAPAADAIHAWVARRVPLSRTAVPLALIVVVALAGGYFGWTLKPATPGAITRLVIPLPDGQTFTPGPAAPLTLSPDGARLVYTANNRLYLRALDRLDATPVGGVESPGLASARGPFFSPDGQWIGFWEARQLKKAAVSGGAPTVVGAITPPPYGVTWAADDSILIGHGPRGLWRVSAGGGTPERIVPVEDGERVHGPQLLPDGRTVLFTLARGHSWDDAELVAYSLDAGARRTIVQGGTDGRYLPTGHLIYALRETLLAVRFDAATLQLKGRPSPVVEGVRRQQGPFSSAAQFAVSSNGTLAYVEANRAPPRRTLVWIDRQGREEPIPAEPRAYLSARLAPDDTRVALDVKDDDRDVWIWDFSRRTLERLTSDPAADMEPVWTPNGQRLIFLSGRTGVGAQLFWQTTNGTGDAARLTDGSRIRGADTVTPDGGLIVRELDEKGGVDLTLLEMAAGNPGRPRLFGNRSLLPSSFNAAISPDGRWLAYQSNSAGAFEIYVRPYPGTGSGVWRASSAGGTEPVWARDGRELFYRSRAGAVMRVSFTPASATPLGTPAQLFEGAFYALGGKGDLAHLLRRTYDVAADGRFLMIKEPEGSSTAPQAERIVVVLNWFEELRSKFSDN